jgi:hypothetical protein
MGYYLTIDQILCCLIVIVAHVGEVYGADLMALNYFQLNVIILILP